MLASVHSALQKLDRALYLWFRREELYKHEENKPLCPVCGTPMEYSTDFMDHIQMEEHETCPKHCYHRSFITGSTETRIGAVIIHGYYTDSKEEQEHQNRIIKLALIHEREERRKKNEQEDGSGRKGETSL